jgi:hypothetical protein
VAGEICVRIDGVACDLLPRERAHGVHQGRGNSAMSVRRLELGDYKQRAAKKWIVAGQPLMEPTTNCTADRRCRRRMPCPLISCFVLLCAMPKLFWMALMCYLLDNWCGTIAIAKIN